MLFPTFVLKVFADLQLNQTTMNLEDILIPPKEIKTEKWQLGKLISNEIRKTELYSFSVPIIAV